MATAAPARRRATAAEELTAAAAKRHQHLAPSTTVSQAIQAQQQQPPLPPSWVSASSRGLAAQVWEGVSVRAGEAFPLLRLCLLLELKQPITPAASHYLCVYCRLMPTPVLPLYQPLAHSLVPTL